MRSMTSRLTGRILPLFLVNATLALFTSCVMPDLGGLYVKSGSRGGDPSEASWAKSVLLAYPAYDLISEEAAQWYADHADMLIIAEYRLRQAQAIRALNKGIRLFMYKTTLDAVDPLHGAPGFAFVDASHPDWFLHERDNPGTRLAFDQKSYSNMYWMDEANPDWQKYWTDPVVNAAIKQGWDGVYMDSLHYMLQDYWAPHGVLEYRSSEAWNRASVSFLDYAHRRLAAAGVLLIGNYSDNVAWKDGWRSYLDVTDGGLDEGFVNISRWSASAWRSEAVWENEIAAMELSALSGKVFYGMAQNRGVDSPEGLGDLLFSISSYFLGRNSDEAYFYNGGVEGYYYKNFKKDYDTFHKVYELDLGKALGARYSSFGVWYREFEHGVVVVNPSATDLHFYLSNLYEDFRKGDGVSGVQSIAGHSARIELTQ